MKVAHALVGFALTMSAQAYSHAGGYSGGGGDYHQIGTGTAWYIGTKEIQYCIDKSANFGFTANELQQNFESAAETWKRYIQEKRIQMDLPQENRLNLNLRYAGICKGNEDLRLYFGSEPAEVIEAKKKFEKPYAFAIRESYDLSTGMGKGFIWFATPGSVFPLAGDTGFPNWSKPYTLHGMMLHELGHVLGVGHLEGTIMRESMMSWMQLMDSSEAWAQSRGKAVLTSIDDIKNLFFRSYLNLDVEGRFSYNKDPNETKSIFKIFMGRDPVGDVRVTFSNGSPMKLVVSDSKEKMGFDISAPSDARKEFSLLSDIFGVYYQGKYPTVASTGAIGTSGVGFLKAKDGKTYTLQYSINAEGVDGPVHLTLLDGANTKKIFFSNINGSIL